MHKTYYITINWDKGSAVTGFLVPCVENELEALKTLKKSLIVTKSSTSKGELEKKRIKCFLYSLKRPWRITNRSFKTDETRKTVCIQELTTPVLAGYWLIDIYNKQHLCNSYIP
jgi:hypothetical protein